MAWVLARTERLHVASGIINITPPVNHPARVAERVAMMDLVSNGRFEFGTGRGSSTTEMGGFGINDPELTKEMYDEALGQIVRMWRDEPYSYDGKFFSMPERNNSSPSLSADSSRIACGSSVMPTPSSFSSGAAS